MYNGEYMLDYNITEFIVSFVTPQNALLQQV